MRFLLFFFISLFLSGCQQQTVKEKHYLDFDSLINAQVANLSKSIATLKKGVTIDGKNDSSSTVLDSIGWSHELDIFRQLDVINRPIYRDVYVVKDGVKDSKSNLLIRSYEISTPATIPYIRLYYQDSPSRIKKIEALYQETNSLYSSQRILKMYFDDSTGKPRLTGFLIEGHQKIMLSDSVRYTIKAEITL